MDPATVVLVHGMCSSSAAWSRVIPLLDVRGIPSVAVQLPSCEPDSELSDAESVRAVLDELESPVVLAGHSFGGMVLTEVGDHDVVKHLVYVDAQLIDVGEAVFEVMDGRVADGFVQSTQADEDGFTFDREVLSAYLTTRGWSDVDIEEMAPGLRKQRIAASVIVPTVAAWRTVPSTFVSCDDSELDRELRALFASRATEVVEIPGDHFPIWRRPDDVAEILDRIARVP